MEFIHYIQQYHSSLLIFMQYFDRLEFYFVLTPILWIFFGSRAGIHILAILELSGITNDLLKSLFKMPRPCMLDPSVCLIKVSDYSFPSGAAQTAIILSSILITSWKSPWRWPLAITYFILLSFSRVYVGAHFPIDILGGWTVGILLFLIYHYLFPPIEKKLSLFSFRRSAAIASILLLLTLILNPLPHLSAWFAATIGLLAGSTAKIKYTHSPLKKFLLDVPITIAVIFSAALFPSLLTFTIVGFWISLISPYLLNKL